MLTGMTAGQAGWLASSMSCCARAAGHDFTIFNALFASP